VRGIVSVLFCHDHRFIVGPDGAVYSRGQFSEAIVARYERGFGELRIAARTKPVPSPFDSSRFNRVFTDSTRLVALPNLSNAKSLIFKDAAASRELEDVMRSVDAVVVRLPSEIGLLAGDVARRLRKPLITEVVGCAWDGLMSHSGLTARAYASLALRRMRRAVARSDWTLYVTERFLQRRYPSYGEQVSVSNVQLPPRDETLLARRLGRIRKGPLVLGMVAAMFHNEKRVDIAIRAAARAVQRGADLRLEVAGPGETAALETLAASLGLADRIRFLGALPHGEPLFSFLDGVDVYVQTSFQEGLPRALIEAMSRALPALGSDAGGTNELLDREWLHTRGDHAGLAGQLLQLRDPKLRVRLATKSFERAADFEAAVLDTRRSAFWTRFRAVHGLVAHQGRLATGLRLPLGTAMR
jgi:glycosyltransferase involved in cell wall biosynthesis